MTVSVVELDIPFCILRYGETTIDGTCPAVLNQFPITNGGFETGTSAGWFTFGATISTAAVRSGTYSARIASGVGGPNIITDRFAATPGQVWRFRAYVMRDEASLPSAAVILRMRAYDDSLAIVDTDNIAIASTSISGWQELAGECTVPTGVGATRIALDVGEATGTGAWFVDDCFADLRDADSDNKCFNTIRTCAARASFDAQPLTLRFCMPAGDVSFQRNGAPVVVIPSIKSITITPAVINPGVDVGTRETVRLVFEEHPHSDAQVDKYLADRAYDPYTQGTFWAKLRARNPSLEGYALRLLVGEEGQDLADMTTYHYVVDSLTGLAEQVTLVAKDMLILADKKKAKAPRISNGVLAADIDSSQLSLTLSPTGIGDAEYPAAGKAAIGGKEIVSFTRSGDTMTIVRAQSGTEADEHDEDDIVQLLLIFDAEEPANIIETLLLGYTPGVSAAWIDTDEWQIEVDEYIGRLYSAEIAEPTPVVDLLNELIEQVGLVFWWDPVDVRLRLTSLRPVSAEAKLYTDDHFMAGSFKATEQAAKRISEVWTYYGVRNPLESLDEANNFQAAVATVDPESSLDYEHDAIKVVFSRWIAANNRPAASRLNSMLLSRYRDAPRKLTFSLYETVEQVPALGAGFRAETWSLQDSTGATTDVPAQVTSIERREDRYIVDAQEAIFTEQDDLETVHLLFIDDDTLNVNLRSFHDQIYSSVIAGDVVRCIVSAGIYVGSANSQPSFVVGDWPASVTIELIVNGSILGSGGISAVAGGTALYTRYAINVTNNSVIAGGGGGGGRGKSVNVGTVENPSFYSASGGGGAGYQPGPGIYGSSSGTRETGGAGLTAFGSTSGAGGTLATAGFNGNHPSTGGGAAGIAVDGESFITYAVEGSIMGARVN